MGIAALKGHNKSDVPDLLWPNVEHGSIHLEVNVQSLGDMVGRAHPCLLHRTCEASAGVSLVEYDRDCRGADGERTCAGVSDAPRA